MPSPFPSIMPTCLELPYMKCCLSPAQYAWRDKAITLFLSVIKKIISLSWRDSLCTERVDGPSRGQCRVHLHCMSNPFIHWNTRPKFNQGFDTVTSLVYAFMCLWGGLIFHNQLSFSPSPCGGAALKRHDCYLILSGVSTLRMWIWS